MQEAGETRVLHSVSTYMEIDNNFHLDKSNRLIYKPPDSSKNEMSKEQQGLMANVNGEILDSYRVAVKETETASNYRMKKELHVHFAEPLVTFQYFNSDGFMAESPADGERACLEENLDRLRVSHNEAKQNYDTELIGVRKLVNNLRTDLRAPGTVIQKKDALLQLLKQLEEALERSQRAFETELEEEKEKSTLLKQKLRRCKISHNKECLRYKTDLLNAKVQADVLRSELELENQQKALLQEELGLELSNAKLLSESLQCQLAEEIQLKNTLIMYFKELDAIVNGSQHTSTDELQVEGEELGPLQKEQEAFQVSHNKNHLKHETDLHNVKQQAIWRKELAEEGYDGLQVPPSTEAKEEEIEFMQQSLTHDVAAAEDRITAAPSLWNRVCYIMGLWRPQT